MKRFNDGILKYLVILLGGIMFEELYNFICQVFPNADVALAYGDITTKAGLACVYYSTGEATDLKDLEGTTYIRQHSFTIELWHDSLKEVLLSSDTLFQAMEGTKFQARNFSTVWRDGLKRKWHRDIQITILEDVE